jgi:hypothetical protein
MALSAKPMTADIYADGDVDQRDLTLFRRCLRGANIPADPNCAN